MPLAWATARTAWGFCRATPLEITIELRFQGVKMRVVALQEGGSIYFLVSGKDRHRFGPVATGNLTSMLAGWALTDPI